MTAAFTVGSAGAAGSPCDAGSGATNVTRWTGASGDNNWDTPGNWDNGVPTPTKIACILKPGTYVVNAGVDSTAMALSLELGATSGSQKLHVSGKANARQGQLTLSNQDPSQGVNANGEIDLAEAASITEGNVTVSAGTLTNRGKVASFAAGSGPNTIAGNFDNRGALQVDENTNGSGTSTWTSSGTINIAAGKTLALNWDANSSFAQTAGTITNNGTFDQINGTFSASGNGTQTGSPLQFDGAVTIDPSGTGSGSFESRSAGATLGSDIGAGYTLRVAGRANSHEGNLKVPADRTNRGTIRLGSADDATNATLTVLSGAKLTNVGTIVSEIVGGEAINGNLDNQGTLQINADTGSDSRNPPGTSNWTSSGTINIAAGKTLALNWDANSSFAQTAGTITNNGTFDQTNGTFSASGNGTQTGSPLQFDGAVTIDPSGTGSGSFESRSAGATLGSDIGAGYTLRVAGRANSHEGNLKVPADRTNRGTIRLGSADDATNATLTVLSGAKLTNVGTIVSEIVGGEAINGNLDNQGTLQINADTGSDSRNPPGTSNWTSSGTINIAAGKTLALNWDANSSFAQTAGTITNNGTFDQTNGTFSASGNGTQTGSPLQFDGAVTIDPSGTGSGSFESRSAGATLGSDIGAGYTLRVAGREFSHEGKLIVPADHSNRGTIELGGENTGTTP